LTHWKSRSDPGYAGAADGCGRLNSSPVVRRVGFGWAMRATVPSSYVGQVSMSIQIGTSATDGYLMLSVSGPYHLTEFKSLILLMREKAAEFGHTRVLVDLRGLKREYPILTGLSLVNTSPRKSGISSKRP
jgi:hypothetical protein